MGQSITRGAMIPSWRRPATNVVVRQWPKGALPARRSPLGHRPWLRIMFVLAPFAIGLEPVALQWLTVQEDQAFGIKTVLFGFPLLPGGGHVGPFPLVGENGFFYS